MFRINLYGFHNFSKVFTQLSRLNQDKMEIYEGLTHYLNPESSKTNKIIYITEMHVRASLLETHGFEQVIYPRGY